MLTLIFRSPRVLQERICGPSRTIAITPEAIYCDGAGVPVAEFRHALWHVGQEHFTSAEIVGPATVAFRVSDSTGMRTLGPFCGLRIISGYLFDGSQMIARAIGRRWYTFESDDAFEQIVLEYQAVRPRVHGILVIEDNDIERIGLAAFLRGEGYQVLEAHNGQDALDHLDKQVPDLILLDMRMPGLDGWRFLEERREDPQLVGVPVVVVTGLANATDAWAEDVGAAAVVPKPVHTDQLLEKVRQFMPASA